MLIDDFLFCSIILFRWRLCRHVEIVPKLLPWSCRFISGTANSNCFNGSVVASDLGIRVEFITSACDSAANLREKKFDEVEAQSLSSNQIYRQT